VIGRPCSFFSNRLVLTDQSFVVDPEKLDKITVSHTFRGRDLRLAVLDRADLRKADFTGAQLQGAVLSEAQLQGATLSEAQLQGARLERAQLQGARLDRAQLQGAMLYQAQLQGARLDRAQLQGATLSEAQLQGAQLYEAKLVGAFLDGAQLQGASLYDAQLQGARLERAQLQGAWLANVPVWRAFGTPNLYLANFPNIDAHPILWKGEAFASWRDAIANSVPAGTLRDEMIERLAVLDPTEKKEPKELLDQHYWDSSSQQGEEVRRKRAMFLADLACLGDSAPYVARGLLRNLDVARLLRDSGRKNPELLDAGGLKLFADRLLKGKSDPTTCPGVRDLTDTDWADLSKLGS